MGVPDLIGGGALAEHDSHAIARKTLYDRPDDNDRKLKPYGPKAWNFAFREPKDDKALNILTGAVRSAKTWAMIPKIIALLRYRVGGARIITGASKTSIYNNVLNDLFDIVGPENYSYSAQSGRLTLFGQQWRVIGAKDEGSEKYIRGSTIGLAYCDELSLMPKSFFDMLLSRMSPQGARLYATTNPDSPHHWLKKEVLDKLTAKDLFTEHFTLDDNPNLSIEYREKVKRLYSGVFYQRFILGLWVVAAGVIYRDVIDDRNYYGHTSPDDDEGRPPGLHLRNGHVDHWIAVDYGTVNPCVFLDMYDDGYTVWVDREYYWDSREKMLQKTDAQYASDMVDFIDRSDQREWPSVIIDPSAASFKQELIQRGLVVLDANNEVIEGISRVSTMLSRKKLRIHRRCKNLIRELMVYAWDDDKVKAGVEEPLKTHDHAVDACRYAVATKISSWRVAA